MSALKRWLLWSLITLAVIVVFLRVAALRWWTVPADDPYLDASVTPSLRGGDVVLLWRMTPPPLGALVVCPEPKHPERVVVARMFGEDRNRVKVEGTHVFVNERVQPKERDCTDDHFKVTPPGGGEVEQFCSIEVANGVGHERGDADNGPDLPIYETELKMGDVALVSDNRRYPYDSRDFGPVARDTCKETVFFRLFGAGGFFDSSRRFQYVR